MQNSKRRIGSAGKVTMSGAVIGISELRQLYAFTAWANGRVLAATAVLDEEQVGRDLGSSFPSVLATLAHIAQSDWIWLRRWNGESPTAPPEWDTSTHATIAQEWMAVMRERESYLLGVDSGGLRRVVSYRRLDGSEHTNPLWQLLLHVVNHSTYHRGQIITMLRQLGATPVSADLVGYYREQAGTAVHSAGGRS